MLHTNICTSILVQGVVETTGTVAVGKYDQEMRNYENSYSCSYSQVRGLHINQMFGARSSKYNTLYFSHHVVWLTLLSVGKFIIVFYKFFACFWMNICT